MSGLAVHVAHDARWRAANNGSGKRIWFVIKDDGSNAEYHERSDGYLVRFATYEAAQKRADRLNAKEES